MNTSFGLDDLTTDFAVALKAVDARRPVAHNSRSKMPFGPGIGPHSESAAISLIADELAHRHPERYGSCKVSIKYPTTKQKCDICFGNAPKWDWAIEAKLLRLLGDNAKPNDHMLMHLLSPYPEHRSALTDLDKLATWDGPKRKAILIYGFDNERWPLVMALRAFEALARSRSQLGQRFQAEFSGLVHPVHAAGAVVAWEVLG